MKAKYNIQAFIESEPLLEKLSSCVAPEQMELECRSQPSLETNRRDALKCDLCVLEARPEGFDGFDLCRKLRDWDFVQPVLMLSRVESELDKVLGLELGADDYLAEPFSSLELLARLRALLRRACWRRAPEYAGGRSSSRGTVLKVGSITLDLERRSLRHAGRNVEISYLEFELLARLIAEPGRCFSRKELLSAVWGYSSKTYEENITAHISRLRKKLESDALSPRYIQTVRGVGYYFSELEDLEES